MIVGKREKISRAERRRNRWDKARTREAGERERIMGIAGSRAQGESRD